MGKIFIKSLLIFGICIYSSFMHSSENRESPYLIKVYLNTQTVDVFHNGLRVKKMPCSTGIKPGSTLLGNFITNSKKQQDVWVEQDGTEIKYYFITRFNDKNAFHSMIEGKHPLVAKGEKLFAERKPSSMGCIRLKKEDAEWVYNLPLGAHVEVLVSENSKN